MTPAQQFITWLKHNDPFMYDVVKYRAQHLDSPDLQGLGFWASVGSALSSVGKAVASAAPAYLNYKQSKDMQKLEKAKLNLAKQQTNAAIKAEQEQQAIAKANAEAAAAKAKASTTVDEILKRLGIAKAGQPQPPTTNYTALVNPATMTPQQYQAAVMASAKPPWYTDTKILLPVAAMAALVVLKRKKRR